MLPVLLFFPVTNSERFLQISKSWALITKTLATRQAIICTFLGLFRLALERSIRRRNFYLNPIRMDL